jgi:hypothetical protein
MVPSVRRLKLVRIITREAAKHLTADILKPFFLDILKIHGS